MSSESVLSQMQQHDIQQKAARETNVLDDPALVTDASQVMAFVRDFYRFYSADKRKQYDDEHKSKPKLSMANKLLRYNPNPTESILVNEDFYKMWTEMSQRVADWFALNGERGAPPDAEGNYNISTLTYTLLESLEQDYRNYSNRLRMVQEGIIKTLSEKDVKLDTLRKSQIDINTMILDDLKRKRDEENAHNAAVAKKMEEERTKKLGAPFPFLIGAEPELAEIITGTSDLPATKSRLSFVTPNVIPTKTVEKEAAEKYEMLQITGDGKESYDRVVAYYKDIIKTIGDSMLSLFRAMNFPVVISLRAPEFTDLWAEYLDSAMHDFLSQAKTRSKGLRDLRHRNIAWDEYDITVDWLISTGELRTYFADFVGHRLTIYPLVLTPGAQVVRPNRMTDNAAHLAAMKFVRLYDHVSSLILNGTLEPKTASHKRARLSFALTPP